MSEREYQKEAAGYILNFFLEGIIAES